jgi:hypothetical protein
MESYVWNKPMREQTDNELNPKTISYPDLVSVARPSKNKQKINNENNILRKYQNVRYMNGDNMVNTIDDLNFNKFIHTSKFFNGTEKYNEKMEKKELANVTKLELANPDQIMSLANEKEVDDTVDNDENRLQRRVFTDAGVGTFRYDIKAPDLVKTVQNANQSFKARRDRYFIPKQEDALDKEGIAKQDASLELLKKLREEAGFNQGNTKPISGSYKSSTGTRRRTRAI